MRTVAFPCRDSLLVMTSRRAYLYANPRKGRGCSDDDSISVDVSWSWMVLAGQVVQAVVRAWELD